MKILIKTESFLQILNPLQPIINDNHIIPVLQNVKLDFTQDELLATGNNLEVICTNSLAQKSEKENSFCVNFTMLLQIVKSIPDEEITLNIKKNELTVIHKKGEFNLPIESSKEFTLPQKEDFDKKAKVKGDAFRSAIKVANKFILNDDIEAMANISLSIGKKIVIRSTDRYRLFEEKVKGSGDKENILLSGKASLALFSLLEDIENDVEMLYNSNAIFFKFDNKEIIVVQQNGDFPIAMFKKVLDTIDEAELLKVSVKELLTALRRVSIMSSKEKYTNVKLRVEKSKMVVSTESQISSTKGEEEIDAKFSEKRLVGYPLKSFIEILSVYEKGTELYLDKKSFLFIKQNKKRGAIAPVVLQS
jgi:DNA polymerase-3 subunit beta